MSTLALLGKILVVGVASLHLYFLVLEMLFWTRPTGLRIFGNSPAQAEASRVLAANQGLYNGFLAAGLLWSAVHPVPAFSAQLAFFFLACVVVAGAYGGYSVSRKIFFVQAVPAILALLVMLAGR
jgi:putative membrane protein